MFWALSTISMLCLINLFFLYRQHQQARHWSLQLAEKTMAYEALRITQANLQTELAELQRQLNITKEDPVTHLISWQLFEDRIAQSLRESARYQFTLGVMYIDITNFELINDALHREVSDALLCEVTVRLQSCLRQVDSITRLANGTFAVLLSELSKPETAAIVAQRILQAMQESIFIQTHELYVVVAIGIAIHPTEGQDPVELLHHAESALHLARAEGKNCYQFYQTDLQRNSQRELQIFSALHKDSFWKELILFYQPVMNIDKKSLFCLEASPVWQSTILQEEMIAEKLFEYSDKQNKLTALIEWMIQHASAQFIEWKQQYDFHAKLAIPLPVKLLENTSFIYRLSQVLRDCNFDPDWLLLDIKLQSVPNSFDILEKSFNMLSYVGIQMAIDHFGAISVPLAQLKMYPAQFLKLDSSLIHDIEHDDRAGAIIKACEGIATNVGMQMMVTGVESLAQLERLREFVECPLIQGNVVSAPIHESQVIDKLATLAGG